MTGRVTTDWRGTVASMARDRTFLDDVRWAVAVLAGFVLGWLVFDADESILIGAAVGVAIVVGDQI